MEISRRTALLGAAFLRGLAAVQVPNVLSSVIVCPSFGLARMILLEATMSFPDLGVQPPTPTWGGMITDGRDHLHIPLAASLLPGIAIALTILTCNLPGDDQRDALDPRVDLDSR